jgi:hypothetical protein
MGETKIECTTQNLIGTGRRPSKDARDRNYPIPNRRSAAKAITQKTWYSKGVLDQGNTSQCVAYSGVKYLTTAPVMNKPLVPLEIYKECLKVDEWPGEDLENGTSVRALFKVLKRRGLVTEYRWAFDCETVVNHVLTTGPVVMGTLWDAELSNADHHGYIAPGKDIANEQDGHAWLVIGANRKRKNPDRSIGAARMINSWGPNWNGSGRAWMSFKDLDKLIKLDGEACVATEVLAA